MSRFALVLATLCLCWAGQALAAQRSALVIGNSAYAEAAPLKNAAADARLMADTLRALDFSVTLVVDADQTTMKRAIAEFGRALRASGSDAVSLFYYAGHAVQSDGINYLLPVEARIDDAADLDLVAVEAAWPVRQMASARNRTSIVILDACRDNPFAAQGLRGTGLARMDAPTGSFIAYSTAPGSTAFDGTGENSVFTAALAKHALTLAQPIEEVFRQVRLEVLTATGGLQTPWESSSLIEPFYFEGGPPDPAASSPETLFWESVKASDDLVELALFLRTYPNSVHAAEARRRLVVASTGSAPALAGAAEPSSAAVAAAAPAPSTPPPSAQAAAGPSAAEMSALAKAQLSKDPVDYGAYLEAYPAGVFAELARSEIAALTATPPAAIDPERPAAAPAPAPSAHAPAPLPPEADVLAFDTPLRSADPAIHGRSIAQITQGSPRFAPIEGLPPEVWRDKTCSACHQWTQEALCTQGKFYLAGEDRLAGKQHPVGPDFLQKLRSWAGAGCR